jgi:hypothetical protein
MPSSSEKQAIIFIAASMLLSAAFLFHNTNGRSETVVTDSESSPEHVADNTSEILPPDFNDLKLFKSGEMEEYEATLSLVIGGRGGSVRVYPVDDLVITPAVLHAAGGGGLGGGLQGEPCRKAPQGGGFGGFGGVGGQF